MIVPSSPLPRAAAVLLPIACLPWWGMTASVGIIVHVTAVVGVVASFGVVGVMVR